jgi:TRAP transporter TAXI family solute receptor
VRHIWVSDTLKAAVEGVAPFSEPIDNVKSIARVMDMHLVFVATKASGITSIEDIGTKKNVNLVTAQKGSSAEILISRILEEYGFNYETVNANGGTVSHQGTGDAAMLMQDGHADVFAALTNTPAPAIMEISATRDLVYLSIDEDIIQKMVDELGYAPAEIPAGTYKDQNEPIKTLSSPIVAICSADLPDEFVYEFAKLLYQEETIKDLAAIHVSFGELTVESGCEHLGAPLHPGAEKYYKEVLQK